MQVVDDKLVLSASDLNNFLACEHLTTLDLAKARGELEEEPARGADAELLARKGDEFETKYLAGLKAEGLEVEEIPFPEDGSREALEAAAAATEEAMRAGAEVIYQATFLQPVRGEDGESPAPTDAADPSTGNGARPSALRGHADFLFRVERPSALGEHSYEVADTKLARRAKPYFILQLCFYSELLAAVQGAEPEQIHVILGTGERRSFRLAEFSAYFRHVRDGFLATMAAGIDGTYPEPVAHCRLCRWRTLCDERRAADDHLSLVANITRRQRELLRDAGFDTLAALGSPAGVQAAGINLDVLTRLHDQAALQLAARESGKHDYLLLEPQQDRGFARLPRPSDGDVFFDMEGDPFFDRDGLEYLFGLVTVDGGESEFTAFWGRDRDEEKRAFEQFVDFVVDRHRDHPDLHVYHYASYEITALKRLAGAHGSREEELDQLLREQVFVDLYKVVKEALRISQPSYSIKKVEAFYRGARDGAVTDGGDSIIEFERWLEQGDDAILDAIAAYNEDDCISTWELREWLLERRTEAEREFEGWEEARHICWFEAEPPERSEEALALREENEQLMHDLLDGVPAEAAARDPEQQARWLAAQLLDYHQREARPVWWALFDRMEAEPEDLKEDPDTIAVIVHDEATEPRPEKQSLIYRLTFPAQETKLGPNSSAVDAADGANPGTLVGIDAEQGWLELKRGKKLQERPFPEALIPGGPYDTRRQRGALRRLATALRDEGAGPERSFSAARGILHRAEPRLRDRPPGEPIDHRGMSIDELKEVVASLDDSHLFIQGPPGSGKTWSGARLIVDLIGRGKRVGVTSTSHKVIHNLLEEIEEVAAEGDVPLNGLKKGSADNPESHFPSQEGLIDTATKNEPLNDPDVNLTAGTAWHYCHEDTEPLDYLFIDEAGQVSLADALALATAARNVVLLGDPQQLPQVSQAAHPDGSSLSVLEHLLGDAQTVDPTHGVFLEQTWRLHPDVCDFVSELMYDGRLGSAEGRESQRIDAPGELTGTGLRWLPVEHEGRTQSAEEEADRIAEAIEPLLDGAGYTDSEGDEHPLTPEDILVLTPYNAQVKCLQDRLPPNIRIGTVDKFQGQEAQITFFSMATSSSEEIPRNVEFLFSRNRLNVAISRARCLAVLVASPRLLDIKASSIEQMRLVNALCRFVEVGEGIHALKVDTSS